MILTGPQIIEECRKGKIVIDPLYPEQCNPNSYNFRLDKTFRVYDQFPLDPKVPNKIREFEIPEEGYVLEPGRLYLGNTMEILGGTHFVPTFAARSSIARLGLFINLSANLGDIGFIGQWTLQLYAIHPLRVYPGMKIGQMMWWRTKGEISLYEGKYQGSKGPQSTLIYRDYETKAVEEVILK
ncbi:dCTP deaminase [Paenibacillus sp. S150]|nr:dCTP deaminase [Paenibacillus sp. S150]